MTYSDAIQFLYSLQMFGTHFGLENTRRLAALAGNPQDQLRFIHVAGTNGKGSTCAMLESIYRAAGLRVGLFTSPHLVSFRERIQLNRQLIPESEIVRLVAEVAAGILSAVEPGFQPGEKNVDMTGRFESLEAAVISSARPGGRMPPSTSGKMPDATTLFEFATVIALKYFAEQKCDLVIWETGLGGRLDATNIVTPLASVITNISFDHQQWLGDSLAKIATEKAGIIKPGIPVVTAASQPEVLQVIEAVAREQVARLTVVGQASRLSSRNDQQVISAPGINWTGETPVPLPLLGEHQRQNAALALATVDVLQTEIPVNANQIHAGLASVNWPGRLQLIKRPSGQKVLLDGAHNPAGASALRAALNDMNFGVSTFIMGFLGDKDWQPMCDLLAPLAAKIFTVPVASARTAGAHELTEACRRANPAANIGVCDSLASALEQAAQDPFVVITGSLYLVGEALEVLGYSPDDNGERGLNEWTARR